MSSMETTAYEGVEMGQIESAPEPNVPPPAEPDNAATGSGGEGGNGGGGDGGGLTVLHYLGIFFFASVMFIGGFLVGYLPKEFHKTETKIEYVYENVCPTSSGVLKTVGFRDAFVDCIQRAVVSPEYVVLPHSPQYYNASQVFSKFYENYPVAVVYAKYESTVSKLMVCSSTYDVKVTARCGGHGNAGNAVQTGAMTIDLSLMNEVSLSSDHSVVTVGAGSTAGWASYYLWEQSGRTKGIPIGQKPSVGIAGLALGGGFGFSTRHAGLLCDHIVSLRAVLPNGTAVTADSENNADLLWASCGGGGGNFAVTTEFSFTTIDESKNLTVFHYYISLTDNVTLAAMQITQYQTLSNAFDNRATPNLEVHNNSFMAITGYFYGNQSEFLAALALADPSGFFPASHWQLQYMDYVGAAIALSGWDTLQTAEELTGRFLGERNFFQFKSFLLFDHLPMEAAYLLLGFVNVTSTSGVLFEFQDFGGDTSVFAQVGAQDTAFPHRNALHCLMLKSWGPNREIGELMFGLMSNFSYQLSEYIVGEGAYVNHMDYELWNYQRSYYGLNQTGVPWNATIVRLQQVNERFDPENRMGGMQLF